MKAFEKAKDFVSENKYKIIGGAVAASMSAVVYLCGYRYGSNTTTFAIHAGYKADKDRLMALIDRGVSGYSGKHLKRLEKGAEEALKAFDKLGV